MIPCYLMMPPMTGPIEPVYSPCSWASLLHTHLLAQNMVCCTQNMNTPSSIAAVRCIIPATVTSGCRTGHSTQMLRPAAFPSRRTQRGLGRTCAADRGRIKTPLRARSRARAARRRGCHATSACPERGSLPGGAAWTHCLRRLHSSTRPAACRSLTDWQSIGPTATWPPWRAETCVACASRESGTLSRGCWLGGKGPCARCWCTAELPAWSKHLLNTQLFPAWDILAHAQLPAGCLDTLIAQPFPARHMWGAELGLGLIISMPSDRRIISLLGTPSQPPAVAAGAGRTAWGRPAQAAAPLQQDRRLSSPVRTT